MARVVVITGVCTQTARATAREFARKGDHLALVSRTPAHVDAAVAEVRELGARALGVVVDTSDADAVESAVAHVEDELGDIDVWVNTADDPGAVPFDDLDPGELRRVTEVCYLGHVHTTMAVLERMKRRGAGTVVHVASALATRGRAGQAALSGAEAALRGFHEALVDELRQEGAPVRVALVQQQEGHPPHATAQAVVQATRAHGLRSQILRAGAVGGGAAVAAGTTYLLRRTLR